MLYGDSTNSLSQEEGLLDQLLEGGEVKGYQDVGTNVNIVFQKSLGMIFSNGICVLRCNFVPGKNCVHYKWQVLLKHLNIAFSISTCTPGNWVLICY